MSEEELKKALRIIYIIACRSGDLLTKKERSWISDFLQESASELRPKSDDQS